MPRDIFTMREVARELDVRNRHVEADPEWMEATTTREPYPIERAALPPGRYMLGEVLNYGARHDVANCATCQFMFRSFGRLGYEPGPG